MRTRTRVRGSCLAPLSNYAYSFIQHSFCESEIILTFFVAINWYGNGRAAKFAGLD